jgi:hypothetical protein
MKRILVILVLLVSTFSYVSAQQIQGGRYKGFVDLTLKPGNDGVFKKLNSLGFGFTTSHGYQVNENIFVGAGVGLDFYKLDYFENALTIPVFANFRANIGQGSVSPFFDLKAGYTAADISGLYLSPSIGARIGLAKNLGLNVGLGYTAQGYEYYSYGYTTNRAYIHSLNISVGIDF